MRRRKPESKCLHVMDRLSALSALAALCALLAACSDKQEEAPPAGGRVNAVLAKNSSYADLCDLAPPPGQKPFPWPPQGEPIATTQAAYRWINVWATWCQPCIEELPLLVNTFETWRKENHPVELTLISVDSDAEAARKFIAERPGTPRSYQIDDASKTGPWLEQVGLPSGAAIPVHILLDKQAKLLCARAGAISDTHLQRFKQVMFP
jgi:hypothetical protein